MHTRDISVSCRENLNSLRDVGLVNRDLDPSNPNSGFYRPNDTAREIYSVLERYEDSFPLEDIFENVKGRSTDYVYFLAAVEKNEVLSNISDYLDTSSGTVSGYIGAASDLGLMENDGGGITITEQGEAVQEFIREIGEIMEEEEQTEEDPVWSRY